MEGVANDYGKRSKIIWANIVEILKEPGVGMKEIVHITVNFKFVSVLSVVIWLCIVEALSLRRRFSLGNEVVEGKHC